MVISDMSDSNRVEPVEKKPRRSYSIDEKLEIAKAIVQDKLSYRKVAAKYGIPASSVHTMVRHRDEFEKMRITNVPGRKRRRRPSKNDQVNELVLDFATRCRQKNIAFSGPLLQAKAKELAALLGIRDFGGSNGWLNSFRKRHGIAFRNPDTFHMLDSGIPSVEDPGSTSEEVFQFVVARIPEVLAKSGQEESENSQDSEAEEEDCEVEEPVPDFVGLLPNFGDDTPRSADPAPSFADAVAALNVVEKYARARNSEAVGLIGQLQGTLAREYADEMLPTVSKRKKPPKKNARDVDEAD